MADCETGCTIRGQHLTECDERDCRGCLPRRVNAPWIVCDPCADGAVYALTRIPDLVVHIRTMVEPGAAPEKSGARHTKADSAPAPLNLAAVADADDLVALVAELADRIAEGRGLTGPRWSGCDIRPAAKRRTSWGDVVYEPARVAGLKDPLAAARIVFWALEHVDWLWAQADAPEAVSGLRRAERGLSLRWPVAERPRYLPVPCPACDRLTLSRYAPDAAGMPVTIVCMAPECRHLIPETQFDRQVLVFQAQQVQMRRMRRSA